MAAHPIERDEMWFSSGVYAFEPLHYENGEVEVEVLDHAGERTIYRYELRLGDEPGWKETLTAYPFRWADKRSAETYLRRPGNLF